MLQGGTQATWKQICRADFVRVSLPCQITIYHPPFNQKRTCLFFTLLDPLFFKMDTGVNMPLFVPPRLRVSLRFRFCILFIIYQLEKITKS